MTAYAARRDGYVDLASYAPIGDGRTVALVAHDGAIDWFPLPDLDSPPVFARLLDAEGGGYIELQPVDDFEVERAYIPGTPLLQTTFTTATGAVRVTDSLNVGSTGALPWTELARRIESLDGAVDMHWSVTPGTMLGTASPWVHESPHGPVISVAEYSIGVRSNRAMERRSNGQRRISGRFTARDGSDDVVAVVATWNEPLRMPQVESVRKNLELTREHWRRWSELLQYEGPYRDDVHRSALILKLLEHGPSGSIAAAATTSLPENPEGRKNYDYRFAWLRDASYALTALIWLGEQEDVHAAVSWLLRLTRRQSPKLHVLNRLHGDVPPSAVRTFDVPGWRGIGPVVAGNEASDQLQLGVYRDIFDMVRAYSDSGNIIDAATGRMLADLADTLCDLWRRRDAGMWELPEQRHYTSSKMACWDALDCAVALAESGTIEGNTARWKEERDAIREFIEHECWSSDRQAYTWYAGSDELDTSVVLHAMTGYERGARMSSTLDALRDELGRGPLFYRYSGMEHEESAFVACSFWMVAALASVGRMSEARSLMDEALALSNDVGSLAEMVDPESGAFMGNLPQALSHLALLTAALALVEESDERTP
ncbi:glycosyl hydrolase [Pseudoclavibacter endophyticus]|uniref:Glycoside hydrolase family 15 protein n=1 Tax=Pseudoclavibacter endophyticus TaxID=1778590 RepID=A0A6H9WTH9_9MICO|nr:glycoside hydrolase family 15 protein [Pseudoclavibacter endophyticus]KAB1649995.1 glycoside hydrolase family 15 protein [Pseudoclavibacter endophyticus]GGA58096.1 glycosyl hydrolase [Pseudoclavibacter endophyticus]